MAHFSYLSGPDQEGVDNILSQATDLVVLEQTSALNLAGVVSDSDLETRFRRLKAQLSSSASSSQPGGIVHPRNRQQASTKPKPSSNSRGKHTVTGSSSHHRKVSVPDPHTFSSYNRSTEANNSRHRSGEEINKNDGGGSGGTGTAGTRRDYATDPRLASRSPPKPTGCVWWSPKQAPPKSKSGGDRGRKKGDEFDWESTEEALKDLGSLPVKEQRQILKKAMDQQRKISEEAKKIVKSAKPATARTESRS